MAESEIVRAALKAILEDPLLQGTPLRSKKALIKVKKGLHSIQEHNSEFGFFFFYLNVAVESGSVSFFLAFCQDGIFFQPSNHFTTHSTYGQTRKI